MKVSERKENEKVLFKNTCSMYGRYNGIYTIYTSGNIDWHNITIEAKAADAVDTSQAIIVQKDRQNLQLLRLHN